MEDRVIKLINEICDEDEKNEKPFYCTTDECRMDAACFVLNRVPQRYVTSGRGFAYLETDFQDNPQLQVDIVTLVHDGLKRVSSIQRSFYGADYPQDNVSVVSPAFYYFPTIKGRIFYGTNFEPANNIKVSLIENGAPVTMIDARWQNPYTIVDQTPGTYLFWPRHRVAPADGVEETFEFAIELVENNFEPFRHYVSISVVSEAFRSPHAFIRDFCVPDLFILPENMRPNEMQRDMIDELL